MKQIELFATKPELPEGFFYEPEFISCDQEHALVKCIEQLEFAQCKTVPADQEQFDKFKEGDRVKVRYRVGKYTNTVWSAEIQ
jgi:hypothetical protein